MKNRRIGGLCALLLLVITVLTGCTQAQAPTNQDPITLGSLLILSGEGASWGIAAQNGIELAIKDINAGGGIDGRRLAVHYEDTRADQAAALSGYRQLKASGINVIIGPNWSTQGMAIKDVAIADETLLFSPSLGVKDFNESSNLLFNSWPHDYILSEDLGAYLYNEGKRTIAVLGAQDVWVKDQTEAVTRRFTELGGSVPLVMEPTVDARILNTEVLKVLANKDIDAIVMTSGVYNIGNVFAKRLRESGSDLPLYSMTLHKDIISTSEGAYDGMVFLTSLTPTEEFEQRYVGEYGQAIEIGAASAYDAVMMLADAMRAVGPNDTQAIANYLNEIKTWNGVSGNLIADGKGGFEKSYKVFEVVDGEPVEMQ